MNRKTMITLKKSFLTRGHLTFPNIFLKFQGTKPSSTQSSPKTNDPLPISSMPGIPTLPIFGSVLTMITHKDFDPKRWNIVLKSFAEEYGPTFRICIPGLPNSVAITKPQDVETMFRATMNNPIRIGFHSLKRVRDEAVDNFFEKKGGLLPENGEEWWRVRSKVQAPMMKPKNIIKYLPRMDQVALDFMDIISDHQKRLGEMPENFVEEIYRWALESVSLVALNKRLGCLQPDLSQDSMQMKLIKTVNVIFECLNITESGLPLWRIFPTPTFRKLQSAHDLFLRMIDENIQITEKELMAKKLNSEDSEQLTLMEILLNTEGLSRKDVITMILDMFFAGIDTTSHTIGFTLYLLARNPQVQKKLHEEVDSVLGDGKETLTEQHLARLSYLKFCVKETHRIFPLVLGNGRFLETDEIIDGYLVPKGHQVFSLNEVIGMNESIFPRPKEFLPERWAKERPLGSIHPFASLPFSHGLRMCIGRRIAEQEIYTFLARAMHRYKVEYKYEDVEIVTKLISTPSRPLQFQFSERKV